MTAIRGPETVAAPTRPSTTAPSGTPHPGRAPSRHEPVPADPTLPGTLALATLTLVAALGMGRLFADLSFLVPIVVAAAAVHGLAWALRRAGASLPLAVPLTLAGIALVAVWVVLPHTTAYGVPTGATVEAARRDLGEAWGAFATVVAPAPVTRGFLLAAMAGVGVGALLADWAAFRVRALFEAAIPSFTLFVFTAILGADRWRAAAVAGYLAALLLFLLVHQATMASETTSWFASRIRGGPRALLQGGAVLGAVAIAAGLIVGPRLPGSGDPPVVSWRNSDLPGPSRRVTVSPLVDIRGRLVEQSDLEVFAVKANRPAYWRLTSLDTFDGSIWQSNESYKAVGRRLPADIPTRAATDEVVQEFSVFSLSSIWLPVAYRPERIEGLDGVSFNVDSGSLIARSNTSDGLTYRVQSRVPVPTGVELQQAPAPLADEDLERYLQVPGVSNRVRQLAADLATRNPQSPYAKAVALQNHFRRGFTYDLKARPGHDGRALDRFLFQTKTGYCEQFAGAYAVLARLMGLPARVAVGFTQGELGKDGRYHVRGLNAHAWPEVYIEGFGWTYFEATPGRGAPGTQQYTGVPEQQADPADPTSATTAPPTTAPGDDNAETPNTSTTLPDETAVDTATEQAGRPWWRHPLVLIASAVALLLVAWVVGVPLAKRARRQRRRARAGDAAERVLVAWAEVEEALAAAGVPRHPAETLDEFLRRVPSALTMPDAASAALRDLGRDATLAAYAGSRLSAEVLGRALHAAQLVERAAIGSLPRAARARLALHPGPLLAHGVRRRVTGRSHQAA